MKKKLLLVSTCFALGAGVASAQSRVTGTVTDPDGNPVIGATVKVNGTKLVTVTDDNGKFVLSNVPASAGHLSISYIGMEPMRVSVAGNVKVVMHYSDTELDQAVVVAYGTAKKSSFTGSVSSVKGEKLAAMQLSNISKGLEGQLAGVQVTQSTGQPGSDGAIYVRGIGSILASKNPLIVVDGVPTSISLNAINPKDIESVNVLKDAAAAALYGSRGANGVIIVTTKQGKAGKTNINFEAKWGFNQRGVPAYRTVTNEGDYYELVWESLRNQYMSNGNSMMQANIMASQNLVGALGNYNSYNVADNMLVNPITGLMDRSASLLYDDDWLDEPFTNGFRQEYNVGIDGGTDKTKYYMSFNYLDDGSYIHASNFKRMSGRVNLEHQATKWLKVGVNASFAHIDTDELSAEDEGANNLFSFAQFIAPIYPIYDYDAAGNRLTDANGAPIFDYGITNGHSRQYMQGTNPFGSLLNDIRSHKTDNLSARAFAKIDIYDGLSFTANFSYEGRWFRQIDFQTPVVGDAANVNGRGRIQSNSFSTVNANQILNYTKTFGKHGVSAMAGHESFSDGSAYLYGTKEQFYLSDEPEFSNAVKMIELGSYTNKYTLESWFGQLQYSYNDKYYVSGSYRRDGSSRFHPDHRWGNFWSVGATWRMKEENWLKDVDWLHTLKLKASYGTQGNDNVPTTLAPLVLYADQYVIANVNDQPGLTLAYRGNPNITWEKSKNFNVGVEAGFFGRLDVAAEFFIKNTDDMLTQHTLSPSEGSPDFYYTNEMAMRNTGVELELGALLMNTKNFTWRLNLNLTHYKNELTRLQEGRDPNGYQTGSYWRKEGGSLYDWYLFHYVGVDPENGDALYLKDVVDAEGNVTGTTTTNDINQATYYETGKSALPKLYGGLSTTLEGFGFDLTIQTAFSFGGYVNDASYASLMSAGLGSAYSSDIFNRWTPTNRYTDVPRLELNNLNLNGGNSDRFLTKASYFSIRNITLGYTLPKAWLKQYGIQGIRIFAVGDNLFLGSARKGLDPRQSITGTVNKSIYSAVRTISFGLNLQF